MEFNGETSSEHGIYIARRPDMPAGRENVDYVTVAGRPDPLAVRSGEYEDVKITVECGFKTEKRQWNEKAWEVRRWLKGAGTLTFSDCEDVFRKVKDVTIKEFERVIRRYGTFEAVFTCDPFEYLKAGTREMEPEEAAQNPFDASRPLYLITGNGTCTLNVNGKSMRATVGQNLTIDTDRMLAYRTDGAIMNTAVTGEYEDLYLKPGRNEISITSGYGLKMIPNWRRL